MIIAYDQIRQYEEGEIAAAIAIGGVLRNM